MPSFGVVNWLAVLVAVVVHQIVGFLWYGPLFGRLWMEGIGKTREELGSPTTALITAAVSALVMAFALALLLTVPEDVNVGTGLIFGAIIGIGFVATTAATRAAYEDTNRTVLLLGIGYQIIGLLIMGAIIGALR
jgi:hypothetical protein